MFIYMFTIHLIIPPPNKKNNGKPIIMHLLNLRGNGPWPIGNPQS